MTKQIVIYKGDEHRAKVEKDFLKTDIFADVYSKAYELVKEIVFEMYDYEQENKKRNQHLLRYPGMGNNIIMFCGARGQGKTSAMQSFARCLTNSVCTEGVDRLDFLNEINTDMFEVVDSIDPSAMENDESILRVLISRLFFHLEKQMRQCDNSQKQKDAFKENKKAIVTLFEKCYENIDHIKTGKKVDLERDDLENLSQLGSSAVLKDNLHDLINKYLIMTAKESECVEKSRRYLVIPIDDADLATKKVFCLCEDIRNYLSIPNVIILMAVDYNQLVLATYQKYLKQYKVIRNAERVSYGRIKIADDCHRMAAKYLEKVFPAIHRIDLPQIDQILEDGYQNIKVIYSLPPGENAKLCFNELQNKEYKNLQEQLLRMLYARTGMIFTQRSQGLHLFFPHTFRELSHWIKMLYDMNDLECDDIYQKYQMSYDADGKQKQNIICLIENIQTIKQYFLNYWCETHLDNLAARAVQEIDTAAKNRQMQEIGHILYEYLGEIDRSKNLSYRIIRDEIIEKDFHGKTLIQEAVSIYFTIFFNEWFALALLDSEQFYKITAFVESIMDLSEFDGKYKQKYNVMQFPVDIKALRAIHGEEIPLSLENCLNHFCVVIRNGKYIESTSVTIQEGEQKRLNPEVSAAEFHVLRPILSELKSLAYKKENSGFLDSYEDHLDEQEDEKKRKQVQVNCLIAVRNIVANGDVQQLLKYVIGAWYEAENLKKENMLLGNLTTDLYSQMAKEMRKIVRIEDEEAIEDICVKSAADDITAMNKLFICNKKNFVSYYDNLTWQLTDIQKIMSKTKEEINSTVTAVFKSGENIAWDYLDAIKEINRCLEASETIRASFIVDVHELEVLYKKFGSGQRYNKRMILEIDDSIRSMESTLRDWKKSMEGVKSKDNITLKEDNKKDNMSADNASAKSQEESQQSEKEVKETEDEAKTENLIEEKQLDENDIEKTKKESDEDQQD